MRLGGVRAAGRGGATTRMFGALRVRDYRLLWLGLVVSNVGSWMQLVALGWHVYLLTESPLFLGLIGLARAVPVFAFALVGGVVADRADRRRVMIAANAAALVFSALLGLLTIAGVASVWALLALALLTAASFSFEMPARQSLMPELVPREHMVNAIGLNAASFNAAGVVGPALAALVIGWLGIGAAYLINAASFLAVILATRMIHPLSAREGAVPGGMLQPLLEGIGYVRRSRVVLALLLTVAVASLLSRPYVQLMPVFARDVLGGDERTLGLLLAASGVGALIGSLLVAFLGAFPGRGLVLLGAGALLGLTLLLFAGSRWIAPSLVLSGLAGLTSTYYLATTNSMLQSTAPPALRGRVISLYSLVVMGFMPLGSMLLGASGSLIGVPLTVALGGLVTLLWAAAVGLAVPAVQRLE
jgi:MFS family permease